MVNLREYESSVSSQFGEDGIIEKIFKEIGTTTKECVELGGYDLKLNSNTFNLWHNCGWSSLIIEADSFAFKNITNDFDRLQAGESDKKFSCSFINKRVSYSGENSLDSIIISAGFGSAPDLISIDVDSIDYFLFDSLKLVKPRVVLVEFNPTIPPHISLVGLKSGNNLGCGVLDLLKLGNSKGYDLVAVTQCNAIFVLADMSFRFDNVNCLSTLFKGDYLQYVMSDYDGTIFLSKTPYRRIRLGQSVRNTFVSDSELFFVSYSYLLFSQLRLFFRSCIQKFSFLYEPIIYYFGRK